MCGACGLCSPVSGKRYCSQCATHKNVMLTKYRIDLKKVVFEHYGNKCSCAGCPEINHKFLTLDHVNGSGNAHRRSLSSDGSSFRVSSTAMHRWIVKNGFPDSFQLLCWNCNSGRASNGGTCPHMEVDCSA